MFCSITDFIISEQTEQLLPQEGLRVFIVLCCALDYQLNNQTFSSSNFLIKKMFWNKVSWMCLGMAWGEWMCAHVFQQRIYRMVTVSLFLKCFYRWIDRIVNGASMRHRMKDLLFFQTRVWDKRVVRGKWKSKDGKTRRNWDEEKCLIKYFSGIN